MEQRLRFEMLLADVCAQFVNVPPDDLDSKIENAQRLVCESLGVDHSSIWQVLENDPDQFVMTHAYRDPKLKPLPSRPVLKEYFPWAQSKILKKQTISVPNTAKVPSDAARDRDSWLQYGVQATLVFPLYVGGGSVIGLLAFDSTEKREWSEPLQRRLQILALVFAQALDRKTSEQKVMMAQEALRASEERLRLAQLAARIGTFEWDIRTGVNTWTPELESMYGLPPGGFGGTQTTFENLVYPDDRARVIELDNWALATGQPTTGEWRVVWSDQSVHWIAGRWQVFMNESGEPSRMVGINIDITDRKLAEQELATANERLQLAIESGSVGGWDFDLRTGKNVWFGKAHAQLGMTPDQTLGSQEEFRGRLHEDDRERVVHALQVAKEKCEDFAEDFRVVWRDGTTHWLRSRGRYYYSATGEPERMLGISLDITHSKQAEQALRESEQRLRLAAQAGRMYAYDWDVTKDVVVRSSEHVEILGLTEPLHLPQQRFVDKIYSDDRPKFLAAVAGLTRENPTAEVTYRVLAPDGTLGWLKSNGRGFFDAEGRLVRVIGMVADVTDVKRAEEALTGMTRKLLEAQEQERTRIGRELHDDINQRLAMLGVELEQLQENPSELQSRVQDLRKQMADLSNDVQSLSHDLHSSKLEYLGVVSGIRSWCKEFAGRQRMEIDFKSDVSGVLPFEVGLALFRVLQEALNNTIKHSGVKRVEVRIEERSNDVHLVVGDSGKGFDVEGAKQGRGLGLISMRERARLVNGTISIESKPMGGTTIHVRVPLGSGHAAKREAS
jgi:PAS domain S-box-containing protein